MPTWEAKLSMRKKEIDWLSDLELLFDEYNESVKPVSADIDKYVVKDDKAVATLEEEESKWNEVMEYSFLSEVPPTVLGDPLGYGNLNCPQDNPVTTKLRQKVSNSILESNNNPSVISLGDLEIKQKGKSSMKDAIHLVAYRKHEKQMLSAIDPSKNEIESWYGTKISYATAVDIATTFTLNDWTDVHNTLVSLDSGMNMGPIDISLQWFNQISEIASRQSTSWGTLRSEITTADDITEEDKLIINNMVTKSHEPKDISSLHKQFVDSTGRRVSKEPFYYYVLYLMYKDSVSNERVDSEKIYLILSTIYCYDAGMRRRLAEGSLLQSDYLLLSKYCKCDPAVIEKEICTLAKLQTASDRAEIKKKINAENEKQKRSDVKKPIKKPKIEKAKANNSYAVKSIESDSPSLLTQQTAPVMKCLGLPFPGLIPNLVVSKLHTKEMGIDTTIPSILSSKLGASQLCSLLADHHVSEPGFVAAWNTAAATDLETIASNPVLQQQLSEATESSVAPVLTSALCSSIGNIIFTAAVTCKEVMQGGGEEGDDDDDDDSED